MFDTSLMEYRLTEDRFEDLCKARHLVNLLSDLSLVEAQNSRIDLNRESLAVTFDLIGSMMDSAMPDLCPNPTPNSDQAITSKNAQDTISGVES